MLVGGNLFNYKTGVGIRKIKTIYLCSLFLKKNFKNFLVVNFVINNKFIKNVYNFYIFTFYFKKTQSVLHLSYGTLGVFNIFLQKNKFFLNTTTYIKYTQIVVTYLKIFLLNSSGLFLYNQKKNGNITVLSSILLKTPKNSTSSIYKNISLFDFNAAEFQFLRKNKVYNKGRYSRCRQNYRTGVYLCMYLSIVSIFGLYYWFFKFSFNFSYLWWFFIGFVGSFLLPKIIKYRLYEPTTTINTFYAFFNWLSVLIKSLKG